MVLRLLIDAVHADETRVVIADNTRIVDYDFVTAAKKQVKGNIYLAKITRVEPSLQAAFVEYGGGKQGFLPFAEIHPDYYQIPMVDRKRLLEEAAAAAGDDHDHDSFSAQPSESIEATTSHESEHVSEATSQDSDSVSDQLPSYLSEQPVLAEEIPLATTMAEAIDGPVSYSEPVEPSAPLLVEEIQDPHTITNPSAEVILSHSDAPAAPVEGVELHSMPAEGDTSEDGEHQEVETLASDDDAVAQARPRSFSRRYKIQEVIKRNQIVLVQVIKEERGNKGVSLTTFISLAGRYCVLMPNSPKGGGISRKISSGEDRKRLKEISAELKTTQGMSAIIRTAGIDRTRAEIKRDYEYLVNLWEGIRSQTLASSAPALIYEEGDIIKRTIRDLYSTDIEEIIVDGEAAYNQAKDFLKMILASHAPRVKLHQDSAPLFYAFNIEDQLSSMHDPVVKLRSGGYIVLNPTEALISIDVNSGRSTGERNIEETATKTNLEAAAEVARQLRLRDLAGLIVIDFIDMLDSRNRRAVERALKDALKLDRAKIQLGRISPFGLLEMSRQRLRSSLSETSTMPCPHCLGKGVVRSDASVAIQIIRSIEKEAASGQFSEIKLMITPSVALHLLNTRRDSISALEQKFGVKVYMNTDSALAQGNFRVDKTRNPMAKKQISSTPYQEPVSLDEKWMSESPIAEEGVEITPESGDEVRVHDSERPFDPNRPPRLRRRGGRNRRDRNFRDRPPADAVVAGEGVEQSVDGVSEPVIAEGAAPQDRENRPPREGGRGGRNRRPRFRDRRDRAPRDGAASQDNGAAQSHHNGEGNVVSYQPRNDAPRESQRESYAPQQNATASSIPPLDQQASSDGKPKKGWWRRIVES